MAFFYVSMKCSIENVNSNKTYFLPCSSNSIVNMEQIYAGCDDTDAQAMAEYQNKLTT